MRGLDLVVVLNSFQEPESKCVNATSQKRLRMKLKAEVCDRNRSALEYDEIGSSLKRCRSAWYLFPISSSSGTLSRETTGGACGRKLREESNNAQHVQNPRAPQWIGKLFLYSPNLVRALRGVPLLGRAIHKLSHRLVGSDEKVWAQVQQGPAQGLWLELNPRTGQNYLRGNVEAATQAILQQRLKSGAVFYDLGANIGLFSLLAARIVGPAGRVFSFEPDPEVAARLRRNVERNNFTNITVVQAGVWSRSCRKIFFPADASSPDRGLGKFSIEDDGISGVALECVALDNFVEGAPMPNAIKCDVEGAEAEVLKGAGKILRGARPWMICALHSEENEHAVRETLSAAGYRIQFVDATHLLAVASQET